MSGISGLTFTVGDGTADATMTFTGTITNVNLALAGLGFNASASTGAGSLQIVTNDQGNTGTGGALSDTDTVAITVANAPVVTTTVATLAYTENATTAVDAAVTVTDADSANMVSATVTMTTNYANGEDSLLFTTQNGISGTWNAGSGTLSLSGSATKAFYQTALRTVRYNNSSNSPSTAIRTVTFVVNDGALNSNTASRTITVAAVNDAPVNGVPAAQTMPRNTTKVFSTGNLNLISISDLDAGGSTVQVQLVSTNGTATLSGVGTVSFIVGDGTADATMTFTGTIANINSRLAGLSFTPTAGFNGAASLRIVTSDLGNTGTGGTLTDTDTIAITVT